MKDLYGNMSDDLEPKIGGISLSNLSTTTKAIYAMLIIGLIVMVGFYCNFFLFFFLNKIKYI